jgi:hypothetical protein
MTTFCYYVEPHSVFSGQVALLNDMPGKRDVVVGMGEVDGEDRFALIVCDGGTACGIDLTVKELREVIETLQINLRVMTGVES